MKIYGEKNVLEAAKERICKIFDLFEHVSVSYSGGKDSSVVLHLSILEAGRRNRLPIKVCFLDQEFEYQSTIDLVERVMAMDEVDPIWLQIRFRLYSALVGKFITVWDEEKRDVWMREKHPLAITENHIKHDRFLDIVLRAVAFGRNPISSPYSSCAIINGMRCQESPARWLGLSIYETVEGIAWGSKHADAPYSFSPIYDWNLSDVWKAICDFDIPYSSYYDQAFRLGIEDAQSRVSSFIHEGSIQAIDMIHSIEPETWDKALRRLPEIHSGIERALIKAPSKLPRMFKSWREYRYFLFDRLIVDEEAKNAFKARFKRYDRIESDELERAIIKNILKNDHFSSGVDIVYDRIKRNRSRLLGGSNTDRRDLAK